MLKQLIERYHEKIQYSFDSNKPIDFFVGYSKASEEEAEFIEKLFESTATFKIGDVFEVKKEERFKLDSKDPMIGALISPGKYRVKNILPLDKDNLAYYLTKPKGNVVIAKIQVENIDGLARFKAIKKL